MSRYLEEAAALLRKSAGSNEALHASQPHTCNAGRERLAREFATLAAIDNGLLPAELTVDILRAITDRHPA